MTQHRAWRLVGRTRSRCRISASFQENSSPPGSVPTAAKKGVLSGGVWPPAEWNWPNYTAMHTTVPSLFIFMYEPRWRTDWEMRWENDMEKRRSARDERDMDIQVRASIEANTGKTRVSRRAVRACGWWALLVHGLQLSERMIEHVRAADRFACGSSSQQVGNLGTTRELGEANSRTRFKRGCDMQKWNSVRFRLFSPRVSYWRWGSGHFSPDISPRTIFPSFLANRLSI